MKCLEFNPYKQLVQFNDLVIDSSDMVSDISNKIGTKTKTTEYGYGNGSYVRFHKPQLFLEEQNLSAKLTFQYKKYRREERKFLKDFIKLNLLKPGRIWAIENNRLIWAYAFVTNMDEPNEHYQGSLSVDVEFTIYEGVWHIADIYKTFLIPYNTCNWMDCLDFRDVENCSICCTPCEVKVDDCNYCICNCDVEAKDSMCAMTENALSGFLNCTTSYRILYSCEKGNKFFKEKLKGIKISKDDICTNTIAYKFYSHTIVDSDLVDLELHGSFQNPIIEINGNKLSINGDYDGVIKVTKNGDVLFSLSEECEFKELDLNDVKFNEEFGFTVHQGLNRVIVENVCCPMAVIYIKVDELTY